MTSPPTAPAWLRAVARPAVAAWLGLEVEGVERVPPSGAAILAATHQSHADALALGVATLRPLTFLGSAHLGALPVVGRLLRRLGLVVVHRGEADAEALEVCFELLVDDAALVVFPEGGRSRDGRVYRPRSGVGRLAAAVGCPVVPVGILGTAELWPPERPPRLGVGGVRVRFGAPLDPPTPDPGSRRRFADELHDTLVELSDAPRADGLLVRSGA